MLIWPDLVICHKSTQPEHAGAPPSLSPFTVACASPVAGGAAAVLLGGSAAFCSMRVLHMVTADVTHGCSSSWELPPHSP